MNNRLCGRLLRPSNNGDISDFDEDGEITRADLFKMIDRLATNHFLDSSAKDKLCDVVRRRLFYD